jgi:hypothetical protein
MENIFVTALYCDDIRQEVGGKNSYMGVYNSDLVVPQFPTTLPKLCAQVTLRFPLGVTAREVIVRISMNEVQLAEVTLPEGELRKALADMTNMESSLENQDVAAALVLQFAPLQLQQPGVMRVLAIVDGRELKGNALTIRLPTEKDQVFSLTQ